MISFVNPRHDTDLQVDCTVRGNTATSGNGLILQHQDWNACNSFENPNLVVPRELSAKVDASRMQLDLPRLSVATVTLGIR